MNHDILFRNGPRNPIHWGSELRIATRSLERFFTIITDWLGRRILCHKYALDSFNSTLVDDLKDGWESSGLFYFL